jgi:hypothetical protein
MEHSNSDYFDSYVYKKSYHFRSIFTQKRYYVEEKKVAFEL